MGWYISYTRVKKVTGYNYGWEYCFFFNHNWNNDLFYVQYVAIWSNAISHQFVHILRGG